MRRDGRISSHQRYVTVVPRVVVDQRGPVGHACYLVAVVPPRHHSGMLVCVLPQPIVGLPEIVQDVTRAVGDSYRCVNASVTIKSEPFNEPKADLFCSFAASYIYFCTSSN